MATPDLPQEILIDIFTRVPAKSVGQFRCLSKLWRALLSTPQFINSHLNRKTHQEKSLILIAPSQSLHTCPPADAAVSTKLGFEPPHDWNAVVGSCHGLVLLVNEEDEKFLLNPITLDYVKVPDSPLALRKGESFSMHGFGYDGFTDEYKIVALSYYDTDNEHETDCVDSFVDVYCAKKGVWKRVECSPYDHAVPEIASGAFVNGAIHWLASSREPGYRSVIGAFSLADEVFGEIPPPKEVDVERFVFNRLVALDGCLCMIDSRSSSLADVWIMKEYGLAESWTKLGIDADYDWDLFKPLCFIGDHAGDEEVVFLTEGESLVVYNVKEGRLREMVVDGVPAEFVGGGTFVESLVSPYFNVA